MESRNTLNRIITHRRSPLAIGKRVESGCLLSIKEFGIPGITIAGDAGFPADGSKSKNSMVTGRKNGFGYRKDPMLPIIDRCVVTITDSIQLQVLIKTLKNQENTGGPFSMV